MTERTVAPTPAEVLRGELARRKNHPAVLAAGLGSTLAQLDQFLVQYSELEQATRAATAVLAALSRAAVATDRQLPGVIEPRDREGLTYLADPRP